VSGAARQTARGVRPVSYDERSACMLCVTCQYKNDSDANFCQYAGPCLCKYARNVLVVIRRKQRFASAADRCCPPRPVGPRTGPRFCHRAAREGERKRLTVLIADVVGSTAPRVLVAASIRSGCKIVAFGELRQAHSRIFATSTDPQFAQKFASESSCTGMSHRACKPIFHHNLPGLTRGLVWRAAPDTDVDLAVRRLSGSITAS